MGLAGAAYGAAQSLEEILGQQMLQAKMAQAQAENAQRLKLEEARMSESIRQNDLGEKFRQSQVELGERTRRDKNNQQGMELMQADKATMDADAALEGLPPRLRQIAGLRRLGVTGITPQDLNTPEETAAAKKAAQEAEFADWKRKQDYDEGQLRSRPKEPKASGPGGLSTAQGNTALKFQDDYARDSKPYLVMRDAYQRVQTAAAKPDAAGDLSMIFAYMKLLDPNSVVREQEFANAQNAAGVPDRIRNTYNQVMKGNRLNPTQRDQFVSQAQGLFANAQKNQAKVRQTYVSRAKQWEIPETMVLDEDDAPPGADAASVAAQALIDKARASKGKPQ